MLKGGPVSAEEVTDAYINSNRALYESNKVMFKDIEAAKTLGMTENAVESTMQERGAGTAFEYLANGTFKPYTVSDAVAQVFQYNADNLGVPNPLDEALPILDRIAEVLEAIPMGEDIFPDLDNPFKNTLMETAGNIYNAVIPPQVNNNFLGAANISVPNTNLNFDKLPTNEKYKTIFPQG